MITLQNGDKLMSMSEVLVNVNEYLIKNERSYDVYERRNFVIYALVAALEEDEDFIRGALK
jgi:hypothetical protein